MIPLVIGDNERNILRALQERAAAHPVDMDQLPGKLAMPTGKRLHMQQMTSQTIVLPIAFEVTYSIEIKHPENQTCRHMSVSLMVPDRVPSPEAVWMIAQELGFVGDLYACTCYWETLERGNGPSKAINIIQSLNVIIGRPH